MMRSVSIMILVATALASLSSFAADVAEDVKIVCQFEPGNGSRDSLGISRTLLFILDEQAQSIKVVQEATITSDEQYTMLVSEAKLMHVEQHFASGSDGWYVITTINRFTGEANRGIHFARLVSESEGGMKLRNYPLPLNIIPNSEQFVRHKESGETTHAEGTCRQAVNKF